MKLRSITIAAGAALSMTLVSSQVRAQVVFDNYGPGDSHRVDDYPVARDAYRAFAFMPSANAFLSEIDIALFHFVGFGPSQAVLQLRADAANSPGAILESWDLAALTQKDPPTGTTTTPSDVVLSLLHPLLLSGTQYWLDAGATDPATEDGWFLAPLGATSLLNAASLDQGATWQGTVTGQDPAAFRVIGSPALATAPEPSSIILVATGLSGIFAARRWRKRSAKPTRVDRTQLLGV